MVVAEAVYHEMCSWLFRNSRQKQDYSEDMGKWGLLVNTVQSEDLKRCADYSKTALTVYMS